MLESTSVSEQFEAAITGPAPSLPRIEYSSAVVREVRVAGAQGDAFGQLFGVRRGRTINVVATRRGPGLKPLGSFVSRRGGGVFLTANDFQRLDKLAGCVVLVVSGANIGFFVRDASGAFGAVHTPREFSTLSSSPPVDPPLRPSASSRSRRSYASIGAAGFLSLVLMLVPLIRLPGKPRLASVVNLRDDKGQMRISWNVPGQTKMTILDRGERISLVIAPQQSSLTYARRSGDLTVGIGAEQVRFIGAAPPLSDRERMRARVEALESKVACLRAVGAAGRSRISALEKRYSHLIP
jgi:hypothetical protein